MRFEIGPLAHLYRQGGFYDDPSLLEQAADTSGNEAVRELGVVFPSARYDRSKFELHSNDAVFDRVLHETFENVRLSYRDLPAAVAVEVRRCLVRDAVIYVQGGGGWGVLYPTYRANDRPSVGLVAPEDLNADAAEWIDASCRELVYLSSAGSFNYGHWLVDDLARLKHVLEASSAPVTLIIQSFPGMDDIRRQTIDLLCRGRDVEIRFVEPLSLLGFERLTYVTPVSYHPFLKSPEALKFIRGYSVDALGVRPQLKNRIYVRRRKHRGRVLRNEGLIQSYLTLKGFRTVDPEALSFEEQVLAFSNASVVVGVMCAALCNVVFSPSQTTLVALAPNGWVEPFYWDMATVLGHRYVAVHGTRLNESSQPHLDDFMIDFGMFKRVIAEILG